jgi:hypothetical protein
LPILKANSSSKASAATVAAAVAKAADDDRRRGDRLARPLSESPPPPRQESPGAPGTTSGAPDHVSYTRAAMTMGTGTNLNASADAGAHQHQQHPALATPVPPVPPVPPLPSSLPSSDWRDPAGTNARPVSAPAPPTGRKLRHLFRRPPVRSASDPPVYSHTARPVMDNSAKRPASEVVPAPREVVERRMPRLPSARDLLRKLT